MKYACLLSGEHKDLAVAEIEAAGAIKVLDRVVLTTEKPRLTLAFTKKVFLVVEDFAYKGSIRVDKIGNISSKDAQKLVFEKMNNPVDLENPDHKFVVIADKELLIGKEIWENTEKFSERVNQKRPAPHPTSLPPKLARAMINLSGARREVLDPFCGSGGILLEAGLMGLKVKGIDIDPIMINRAKMNLDHFGVHADLQTGNAVKITDEVEAIVTDLPYGRNSKAEDLEELYSVFMAKAKEVTTSLVVGLPSFVDDRKLVREWKVKHRLEWDLHKSLKKIVYVLHFR